MRKLLSVVIALSFTLPLFAESKSRYMISMRRPSAVSSLKMVRDTADFAAHDVRTFRNVDMIAAELTESEAADLRKSSDVRYVSPVVPRYINDGTAGRPTAVSLRPASQSNYSKSQQIGYGIDLIHARDVWRYSRGTGPINVAIVDTGIDYRHPELKDRYAGGYNVFTKKNDPMDDHSHGTHVAGIIGAADNNFGVVGVAPEVRIWSAKVLDNRGTGSDETVIAGMDWVISKKHEVGGDWIVNLSLGAEAGSDAEKETFQQAIDEGILIVAAAGNRSERVLDYPAIYLDVLAISAIDSNSDLAIFSSWGPGIAFAGPGVEILSTVPLGFAKLAEVNQSPTTTYKALPLDGSALGSVTADTVFCGVGKPEQIPASVRGKIALIKRGDIYFRDKAKNAINAGAVGVVIVPTFDDGFRYGWTLFPTVCSSANVCGPDPVDVAFPWTVVISTDTQDGDDLIANAGKQPITINYSTEDYAVYSGTSMATPHVVGAAALAWSLAPDATAAQIRLAMKLTAADLGDHGYDEQFGYGRIDALAAAKYVAPGIFGLPPNDPLGPSPRRRSSSPRH